MKAMKHRQKLSQVPNEPASKMGSENKGAHYENHN